jgi:hypothetical protein
MPATDLVMLLRDFVMAYNPNDVVPLDVGLSALSQDIISLAQQAANEEAPLTPDEDPPDERRRRLQQTVPTAVSDPFVRNGTQWHHAFIRSRIAWSSTPGSPAVVVAVIDSGFDITHPDLVNRLWINTKEVPNNGIDDDGNGVCVCACMCVASTMVCARAENACGWYVCRFVGGPSQQRLGCCALLSRCSLQATEAIRDA